MNQTMSNRGARRIMRLAVAAACLASPAMADLKGQFISAATDIATKIATDPGNFLFDVHLNAEDQSPLPAGKVFSWSTNIFPNLFPFGELGLELKGQAHREHGAWPQIDIFAGGWDSIAATVANSAAGKSSSDSGQNSNSSSSSSNSTSASGSLIGYHGGFVVTESLHPRLRVFGGYEYSQMRADISIKQDASSTDSGSFSALNSLTSITVGVTEHFLFAGAEVYRTPVKRLNAEVGYGIMSKRVILRMIWASPHFDTALNFFPEGALALWPVMNFQWRY